MRNKSKAEAVVVTSKKEEVENESGDKKKKEVKKVQAISVVEPNQDCKSGTTNKIQPQSEKKSLLINKLEAAPPKIEFKFKPLVFDNLDKKEGGEDSKKEAAPPI